MVCSIKNPAAGIKPAPSPATLKSGVEHKRPGRRAYFLITLFAFLLVLFPFLFWYATWFGRKLADREIDEYLANAAAKPRQAQHALVQIGERLSRGDAAARRWYPKVIEDASSPAVELLQC